MSEPPAGASEASSAAGAQAAYLALILDLSHDGVIAIDRAQRVILFNRTAERIFGYSAREVLGQPLRVLLPDGLSEMHHQGIAAMADGPNVSRPMGEQPVVSLRRRDGTPFYAEVNVAKVTHGQDIAMIASVRDITLRSESREALRQSEERFERVFRHAALGMALVGTDGCFVQVNASLCRMLGYSEQELLAHTFRELTYPDDVDVGMELFRGLVSGERDYGWLEKRYVHKDGHAIWTLLSTAAVHDPQGKTLYLVSQLQDISERKAAEARLMETEAQYRGVFEASSDGLLVISLDGRIVEVNPAACKLYGYTHDELLNIPAAELIRPEYRPRFAEMLAQVGEGEGFFSQVVDRRKDGSAFHVEVYGSSLTYAGQRHLLAIVRDVTERVRSVQLLEQRVAERTHELSTLLAVSHNIAATLDLGTLLDLILDQLRTIVDHDSVILFALEEGRPVALRYRGLDPQERAERAHLVVALTVADKLGVRRGETAIIGDAWGEEPLAVALRDAMGEDGERLLAEARSWMHVPLKVKERTIGILTLARRQPHSYSADHARLALAIASQAASAIENARLYEQGQRLAALEERQRLARELHDSVSQALYGISLAAHTVQGLLERGSPQAGEPLDYLLRLADAALAEMRALIFELRPDSLEREGLVSALNKHVAAIRARHGLDVDADLCEEPGLPFPVKEALYRVAQEALNNAIKHARASRLEVRLSAAEDHIALSVRDNGIGFDPHGQYPGHMGLHSMRERMERLNGALRIDSAPGQGSVVQATVQLDTPHRGAGHVVTPTSNGQ
jgi:PAS domain S-box-containing protein